MDTKRGSEKRRCFLKRVGFLRSMRVVWVDLSDLTASSDRVIRAFCCLAR